MKKLALLTSVAILSLSTAAYAGPDDVKQPTRGKEHHQTLEGRHGGKFHDPNIASMTEEQRSEYFKQRKAEWEKMSDAEKVKIIEQKRAERIKAMDAEWKGMTDAEKIKHVEKKMHHKKGGCKHDLDGKKTGERGPKGGNR